jgi:hypothetical protein
VVIECWAERLDSKLWAAPRKLVHLKWKSLGKLGPGGIHE